MAHAHSHGIGHHAAHQHHGPAREADARRLIVALALILGLMAAEVLVGILSHALVLLSDAGHMLTDAAAQPDAA